MYIEIKLSCVHQAGITVLRVQLTIYARRDEKIVRRQPRSKEAREKQKWVEKSSSDARDWLCKEYPKEAKKKVKYARSEDMWR